MGLSRRFRNLILDSPFSGTKWLRCVDLSRQLFYNTATPPSTIGDGSALVRETTCHTGSQKMKKLAKAAAALKMERIRLPRPILRIQATPDPDYWAVDCFAISNSKVVVADHTGRTFLCNTDTRCVVPMPNLHKHKSKPISISVPSLADAGGHTLYVMERIPHPEKGSSKEPSNQFEAFVCSTGTSEDMWHCQLIPPPPFVRDPAYWFTYTKIRSYAVVGSNICVSTDHNDATTYCLDTASNTWEVGNGVLPFYGKVEYVPELKLWFGLSTKVGPLGAADLSLMDSQPQLVGDWNEFDPPEGWVDFLDSQLVNLGSGRFCIARFYTTMPMNGDEIIVVFTGVEVTPVVHDGSCSGDGKVKLHMKRHKSRYHVCNHTFVCDVF